MSDELADSDSEYLEEEYEYDDDFSKSDNAKVDPEYLSYDELQTEDAQKMINKIVDELSNRLKIAPIIAKVMLQAYKWSIELICKQYQDNPFDVYAQAKILPQCYKLLFEVQKMKPGVLWHTYYPYLESVYKDLKLTLIAPLDNSKFDNNSAKDIICDICYILPDDNNPLIGLVCGHQYCKRCWLNYFSIQLEQKMNTSGNIECMGNQCRLLVLEDLILNVLTGTIFQDIYLKRQFNFAIESHPQLRFCTNSDCGIVVYAESPKAKRVKCTKCHSEYCFKCGLAYHAPTSCKIIQQWLLKCRDDWETANYITAYTKDCPACGVCIEKNGGCNHMMCFKCKFNFCWMCLQDWKTHQAEYYECSRYKENPNSAKASEKALARDSLRKYLFYYERYENHERSLRLEDQQYVEIKLRIDVKVKSKEGTWIDWQYLLDGAATLLRCRYTLKYTYPYAYYLEKSSRKHLFEYQQSILEREVEDLAWKIQNASISDRKQLEAKMNQCEMYRKTLIHEFIED